MLNRYDLSGVLYRIKWVMCASTLGDPHLPWAFPSNRGGKGKGGRVDVLWSEVCRTGLRVGSGAGDLAWGGWIFASAWGGGGGTSVGGPGGTGGEGWGRGGAGEDVEEEARGAVTWSSLLPASCGNCAGGGGWVSAAAAESLSDCEASALADREALEEPVALHAATEGEEAPLARAAASAACRSFFLRLSSAPRLELRGRREGLAGRLLWEPPPPPAPAEEVCLLLREREEERREE